MKKTVFAFVLLCIMCMCACQPTPEAPVVVSKGDGKLQDSIYGTPAPMLSVPYQAPEAWKESIDESEKLKLLVNIDATITVPSALSYPVCEVHEEVLGEREIKSFVSVLFDNKPLYAFGNPDRPKSIVLQEIEYANELLNNPNSILNKKRTRLNRAAREATNITKAVWKILSPRI